MMTMMIVPSMMSLMPTVIVQELSKIAMRMVFVMKKTVVLMTPPILVMMNLHRMITVLPLVTILILSIFKA